MTESSDAVHKRIGVVSSTAHTPTTTEQFAINLDRGQEVKRFDLVTVPTDEGGRTHGVITEIVNATEAPSHLTNYMDTDLLTFEGETQSKIFQVTTATAAVLSNTKGCDMPVPHGAPVFLATSSGIHEALGISQRIQDVREHMIPVGFLRQSNGVRTIVYIDHTFLLGDEGAHLNASGIPGLATKTSFLLFMLQSILQSEAQNQQLHTGVIIFNSKKADLLRIHEPREDLRVEDIADWEGLGLSPLPFTQVQYFLPRSVQGTPNSFPPFPPHRLYGYTLAGAEPFLDLLFSNVTNDSHTIQSTLSEIREMLTNPLDAEYRHLKTWDDLVSFLAKQTSNWRGIQPRSLQLVVRLLRRMLTGPGRGLFVNALAQTECLPDDSLANFRAGDVYVFDIANLRERDRGFVVGSILRTIEHLKSDPVHATIFPEKVIIYLDELGKYAPRGVSNALVDDFIDIAERGRSSGEILFGAEQSRNAVHDRIIGSIANSVIGMTGSAELGGIGYASLSPQIKTTIPRLIQGEMVFIHPVFRLPVKINFPRPAWK